MNETRREIDYEADGVQMVGYFAADGGSGPAGRRPGILVSPPGPGLGEHTKGVVRRLAGAGYMAFGLDYHGHGVVVTDGVEMRRRLKGKVLICLGADDPLIPPAERIAFEDEMRNGQVDWQMHLYGGAQHSFTDPGADERARTMGIQGLKYDAADRRSWRSMLDLFSEIGLDR